MSTTVSNHDGPPPPQGAADLPSPWPGPDQPPRPGAVPAGEAGTPAEDGGDDLDDLDEARRERRRTVLIHVATWVRNIGALLILFAAWQLWGTAIAQHHSQTSLKQQFTAIVHGSAPPARGFALSPATAALPSPAAGAALAFLQIPKIGLNEFVVEGTAADDLAKGPGHYTGTALPGQAGNVAIAGHRTTYGAPFYNLNDLAPGDPIYLTDLKGQRLTYVVGVSPFAVSPSDSAVLSYFHDDRLTLTTCNPRYSATQRLVVVAFFKPPGAAHPAQPTGAVVSGGVPLYKVAASGEAGWNARELPWVFLELAALVALGLTNHRWASYFGQGTRWLVLIPIWTALLYLTAGSLGHFLPASV